MDKVRVLITAIGGGGHGDQILKALRLAGERYEIFGADMNPHCPQREWVSKFVTLPAAADLAYMDGLLTTCRDLRVQALFHGCEPELKLFSKNRDQIENEKIFLPINTAAVIDLCMDKAATNAKLSELGFSVPRFVQVSAPEALDDIDWFPVVVKPARGGGGSASVYLAQDADELRALARYLHLSPHSGFMVQEYVGTPDSEYTVGVLSDMDGCYINAIAVHRHLNSGLNIRTSVLNHTGRSDLGTRLVISSGISHGKIGRFEDVTSQCHEIAAAIGARGALNIQCRLVDGKVRVFEINPRFSGTTSLRAMVGYNEPDVLLRHHFFGEKPQVDFPYEEATILRGLTEYKLSA